MPFVPRKQHQDASQEGGDISPALAGIRASEVIRAAASALAEGCSISIGGLWGASGALVTAALSQLLPDKSFLVITPSTDAADTEAADIESFLGTRSGVIIPFPAWDILPEESEEVDADVLSGRLSFLRDFGRRIRIGIAPVDAAVQAVPAPGMLEKHSKTLTAGTELPFGGFIEWLSAGGYRREASVATAGEFAVRGGVIDVWPLFGGGHGGRPVRIELADERVESLRIFEPTSQRSIEVVDEISIGVEPPPVQREASTSLLTDHLDPRRSIVVIRDGGAFDACEGAEALTAGWKGPLLRMTEFAEAGGLDAGVKSVQRYSRHPEALKDAEGTVFIFSSGSPLERLRTLVKEKSGRESGAVFSRGFLSCGFQWPSPAMVLLSDAELLERPRMRRTAQNAVPTRKLVDVLELTPGDYVVHVTRGIARYLGVERLDARGRTEDFLSLQFAEQARLYVPLAQMYLIQKYIGPRDEPPDLSAIGSLRWARRKERALEAARDAAAELLETHARRASAAGIPYPPDDALMEEFEAAFPYEDTPDQSRAYAEIRQDMEAARPMERLVCGDVGFGKTELAVRAVFKSISAGRQAAVLVPTTILAEQHMRTFRGRLEPFAVSVEMLNRYRGPSEQKRIVREMKEGRIDVVIGTQRLLQEDVGFRRLGLLVIDEEQRFGVAQKERVKQQYPSVDVLLLSATPIPRTLHMALAGIKDISTLATPPPERYGIRTAVIKKGADVIRRALLREVGRGGQAFYLHNRVSSLEGVARELGAVVPEARIAAVHGQMSDRRLADTMRRFLDRQIDVLVSTSIVESGLDIPTVNTILIDDPERYGLSELHQLRGRVGRYHRRAFCYLLVPAHASLGQKARRRLKAIEELQHIGAGFDIAVRDMELRGIGSMLGLEQ
ncbi:MAG TPA: DEAD/DEAH box helicase, partial [Planctomycetes bacterium]|nr:DEAD/DEAH box helicase [Planctomycetota bacterium]